MKTALSVVMALFMVCLSLPAAGHSDVFFDVTDPLYAGGAICDDKDINAAQNSAAIQAAIDAARASGGGTVLLPVGTCVVDTGFVLYGALSSFDSTGKTNFAGHGRSSRLRLKGLATIGYLLRTPENQQNNQLVIRDLTLDGNKQLGAEGSGISLFAARMGRIQNVRIVDFTGIGVRTWAQSPNFTGSHVHITHCDIGGNEIGIRVEASDIRIEHSRVFLSKGHNVYVGKPQGPLWDFHMIDTELFTASAEYPQEQGWGVYLDGVRYPQIIGNRFDNNAGGGLRILGTEGVVTGNRFARNGSNTFLGKGLFLVQSNNIVVTGNHFYNVEGYLHQDVGIYENNLSRTNIITDNMCRNALVFGISASSEQVTGSLIQHNLGTRQIR